MAERAGYDQKGDEYTVKNASFVLGVPSTYQKTAQQEPDHLIYKPSSELTNTTVVMSQPQPGTVLNIVHKPLPNHMVPALCVMICCFWPTGLFAVYFAYKTRNLELSGDYGNAKVMSDFTRKWIIATVLLGIFVGIISAIVYYAEMMNYYDNIHKN
ncbi:proline-rich transmembrane protein 1-like isoform X2 [Ruditapes philippinarum]|uniref:proline-rich transmembrane protein 1-like isoform X2 n=1 Tax=Ruditapes philippinarum TaxID=129788 RepID=UPI00295AF18B|nr:proline-rich transmembrane protein 1-like isoform X2 [Ruditapes philippinarum]